MTQLGDVLFDLGISRDTLNRPCSVAHANEISLHIVNWESLSPFLGLKETDEEDIRHSGNRAAQRIALLRRWKQIWGFKATYLRLAEAFAQIGNRELVERLCKLVTKGSVEVVGATSPSTETQSAGMPKLSDKPQLHQFQMLRGKDDKKVRVISELAACWEDLALALHFDGNALQQITRDRQGSVEAACREILTRWLAGEGRKPVTWATFIDALEDDMQLSFLPKDLRDALDP